MSKERILSEIEDQIGQELTKKQLRAALDIVEKDRANLEARMDQMYDENKALRSELLYLTMNPQQLMDNALEVEMAIERTQSECNRRVQFFTRDLSSLECVQ